MLGHTSFDFTALVRGEAIKREGEQFDYQLGTLDYEERLDWHQGYYLSSTLQNYWPEYLLRMASPKEIAECLKDKCPDGTYITVDSKVIGRRHVNGLFFWYIHKRYTYTLHCTEGKSKSEYERHLELERRRWRPKPLIERIKVDESFHRMQFLTKEAEDYCEYLRNKRADLLSRILKDVISRSVVSINTEQGQVDRYPEAIYVYSEIGNYGGICENKDYFDYHDKIVKPYWVENTLSSIVTWREYGMKPPKSLTGFLLAFAYIFVQEYPDRSVVLKWDSFRGEAYPMMYISASPMDGVANEDALEDF